MTEVTLKRPALLFFYGFPGAGKSYVAKNLAQYLSATLVSEDAIRNDLFDNPQYNEQENQTVRYIMDFLAEQLLKAGMSVVLDINATRLAHRRRLRAMASKHKSDNLLVWVQIDPESAFSRTQGRDRRRSENKFAAEQTRQSFNGHLGRMENPQDESYVVVSGKHSFVTQRSAILNRLYQMGLVDSSVIQSNVAVPGLINLIPMSSGGRVDLSRRDITIS